MSEFENTYVVIVEDDTYSADVLADFLNLLKAKHTAIRDGSKIVEAMQSLPQVHAVFLDLELPNQDGYKVLKTIQSHPQWKNIPIVAYTSHTSHMSRAKQEGFHSFLGKPLSSTEFPKQFSKILNNQPVWE